jgi:hypothetical protein
MSLKNILSTLTRGGGCQNQRKLLNGSHDIQPKDTQYNDSQHKGLICDTQHE